MILGNIEQLELVPYLPKELKEAIEFIRTEVHAQTPNDHYEIDGDDVFFMVSENEPRDLKTAQPEFHERYIDIQIVLEGEELFGICFQSGKEEQKLEDRLETDDIAFIKTPANEVTVLLRAGDFAIFYPNELHKPLGQTSSSTGLIKKVVVKVALDRVL